MRFIKASCLVLAAERPNEGCVHLKVLHMLIKQGRGTWISSNSGGGSKNDGHNVARCSANVG